MAAVLMPPRTACWLCLLAACAGAPTGTAPGLTANRILAIDGSPNAVGRRLDHLLGHLAKLPDEVLDLSASQTPANLLAADVGRVATMPATVRTLVTAETSRRPTLSPWLPTPTGVASSLADGLAAVPVFIFGRHRPMQEADDRQHRLSPHDDRPETNWWQRLQRRFLR